MTQIAFGKLSPPMAVLLGVLLLISAAAELFITWLLVEHVPWLGWPVTVLTIAGVVYAIVLRLRRKRPPVE